MSFYRQFMASGFVAVIVLYMVPASAQQDKMSSFSDGAEIERFRSLASQAVGTLGGRTEFHSEGNLIGFRSEEMLFSQRLDSRTYFFQDLRKEIKDTESKPLPKDEVLKRVQVVFHALDLPVGEIADQKVLEERNRVGQRGPAGEIRVEQERYAAQWAEISRQVEGIPVFSSRALFAVSAPRGFSFFEVNWPDIPRQTLLEAHRLDYKVKTQWDPPQVEGAQVESIVAGIVHSPALGFVMDVYPAIRVIYRSDKPGLGKKAVRYYDRTGRVIPIPRQFAEKLEEPKVKREASRSTER